MLSFATHSSCLFPANYFGIAGCFERVVFFCEQLIKPLVLHERAIYFTLSLSLQLVNLYR